MITFDAELHRYYAEDGTRLRSVTEILRLAGLVDATHHFPAKAAFGNRVHEACAGRDRGDMSADGLDPKVGYRLVAWWMYRETACIKVLEIEKVVGSKELGYAGTLDRVVELDGDKWVLDLKTGSPCPWHQLQLAAYALAYGRPMRRMAVYLKPDCEVRTREFIAESDYEEFLRALAFVQEVGQ